MGLDQNLEMNAVEASPLLSDEMPLFLDRIVAADATRIRATIDESVVETYADRMLRGIEFPPIVVFSDGTSYHLADGFYRVLAAKRCCFGSIRAEVKTGTQADALWFALASFRSTVAGTGHTLTVDDRRHAINLASRTWPEQSSRELAEQIGCDARFVRRVRQETEGPRPKGRHYRNRDQEQQRQASYLKSVKRRKSGDATNLEKAIEAMVRAGAQSKDITSTLGAGPHQVATIRRELGFETRDRTREGVKARIELMRQMARENHSTRQIAVRVGLGEQRCRSVMRREGIEVPADKMIAGSKRLDYNRIVSEMVVDAENVTSTAYLIEFDTLDPKQLSGWIESLRHSIRDIGDFVHSLVEEQKRHGKQT